MFVAQTTALTLADNGTRANNTLPPPLAAGSVGTWHKVCTISLHCLSLHMTYGACNFFFLSFLISSHSIRCVISFFFPHLLYLSCLCIMFAFIIINIFTFIFIILLISFMCTLQVSSLNVARSHIGFTSVAKPSSTSEYFLYAIGKCVRVRACVRVCACVRAYREI